MLVSSVVGCDCVHLADVAAPLAVCLIATPSINEGAQSTRMLAINLGHGDCSWFAQDPDLES